MFQYTKPLNSQKENMNFNLMIKTHVLKVLYIKIQMKILKILINYFIMQEVMIILKDMDFYI